MLYATTWAQSMPCLVSLFRGSTIHGDLLIYSYSLRLGFIAQGPPIPTKITHNKNMLSSSETLDLFTYI